jgi:hypothetical protein
MKKRRPHHTIPFDVNTQEHYLLQLHAVISDYFMLTGKPKHELIFYRRYHGSTDKKETLESLGRDFQVTRERIRQITHLNRDCVKKLLSGKTLKKPHCSVSEATRQHFISSVEKYCRDGVVIKRDLIEDVEVSLPEDKWHYACYLDLLMESLEYNKEEYHDQEYYIASNSIIKLDGICDEIKTYISRKVFAVTLDELTTAVKLSSTLVKTALKLIPEVCQVAYEQYVMPDRQLTQCDRVYSILKDHGKPIHFKELLKEVGVTTEGSANRFLKDGRLTPIGKTGMWALTEWHMNNDTIIGLIKNALKYIARPATYDQIATMVLAARPETSPHTIKSLIYTYRSQFKWVGKDTIALKTWKKVEGSPYEPRLRQDLIDTQTFKHAVVNAVGEDTLTALEVADRLESVFPNQIPRYLLSKVYSTNVLERLTIDELTYFRRHPDYIRLLDPKILKKTKIADAAFKLIVESGSTMRLVDLIEKLCGLEYKKISIYSTLYRDRRFITIGSKGCRGKLISIVEEKAPDA